MQEFQALSAALSEGLGRLKQGKVDSELIPADVSGLKSMVESGLPLLKPYIPKSGKGMTKPCLPFRISLGLRLKMFKKILVPLTKTPFPRRIEGKSRPKGLPRSKWKKCSLVSGKLLRMRSMRSSKTRTKS